MPQTLERFRFSRKRGNALSFCFRRIFVTPGDSTWLHNALAGVPAGALGTLPEISLSDDIYWGYWAGTLGVERRDVTAWTSSI